MQQSEIAIPKVPKDLHELTQRIKHVCKQFETREIIEHDIRKFINNKHDTSWKYEEQLNAVIFIHFVF
jgi:uncharacterized protein YpuA (DUF1002 family)